MAQGRNGRAGTAAAGNVGSVPRTLLDCLAGLNVPHLDQYFGVWAIQEDPFRTAVARIGSIDIRAHVEARQSEGFSEPDFSFPRVGSTAVISLRGPLMKQRSSMSGGTSTVEARRQIRNAANDDTVRGILLVIDSPGGTVAGTADLAADIAAAAKRKNTVAYIEDLGASAAYWAASQARKVYSGPTAMVGSIGTFMVVFDASKMAENEGVKVHVVRAGEFKGAGVLGTAITDEQLAEWQRGVDAMNDHFIRGVAAGRGLGIKAVRELADGRVHVGQAALELKLIDGVQSLDATLAELNGTSGGRTKGAKAMAQDNDVEMVVGELKSSTATIQELRAALPKASADFIVAQLEAKATVEQATAAFARDLAAKLEAADKELADLKAKSAADEKAAAEKGKQKSGVPPLGTGEASEGTGYSNAADEFNTRVQAKIKAGYSKARAISAVAAEDPDLHRAYLVAHNTAHGRRDALAANGLL